MTNFSNCFVTLFNWTSNSDFEKKTFWCSSKCENVLKTIKPIFAYFLTFVIFLQRSIALEYLYLVRRSYVLLGLIHLNETVSRSDKVSYYEADREWGVTVCILFQMFFNAASFATITILAYIISGGNISSHLSVT